MQRLTHTVTKSISVTLVALIPFMGNVISVGTATAGVIRDDRADSLYTGLAGQPKFHATGFLRFLDAGGNLVGIASATVIAPHWILTAGHCVIDENGPTATSWEFQIDGQTVAIPPANAYFPADWVRSGFDSGYDVAMFYLPVQMRGVQPAAISASTDELRKVITTLGYGTTGDGRTGNTGSAGTRRAGQNVFDATSAMIQAPGYNQPPIPVGSDRTLLFDFDNPQGTSSTLGQATPLNLEYSAAPGDSGGGAFMVFHSTSRIVGVVSAGISPNGLAQASYGTTAIYARVSSNLPWMRRVMAGQEASLPTMVAQIQQGTFAAAVQRAQTRESTLAGKGYRLCRYVLTPAAEPRLIKPAVSLPGLRYETPLSPESIFEAITRATLSEGHP